MEVVISERFRHIEKESIDRRFTTYQLWDGTDGYYWLDIQDGTWGGCPTYKRIATFSKDLSDEEIINAIRAITKYKEK